MLFILEIRLLKTHKDNISNMNSS